jgi:dolichol-phosphate mannosyltransferase
LSSFKLGVRIQCSMSYPTRRNDFIRTLCLRIDTRWRFLAIAVVAYSFGLRLLFSGQIELLPEEAYYWNYSRHLDIGYLDHPPLVAWLIRMGTGLFGNTEFGIRFAALGCGVAVSFFVFRLTRNLFGESSAWAALVFAQVLPYFFLSGMLMTPDAPLSAAWAATLYFLERALLAGRRRAWAGVGVAFGLGMLSKYTIGLLGLGAFIFMLDAKSRPWFRRWEPYAAVLIAAALFAPVIVWNAQHDWASFAFQTSRRLAERPQFALHKLIGGALVLLTPTGLATVWLAYRRGPDAVTAARARRFLGLSLGVPLIVFTCFSLRHEVKLDWTGAPWLAALPVMAYALVERPGAPATRAQSLLRAAWVPTLLVLLLFYGGGFYYLAPGIPGLSSANSHMELVPFGWRDLGRQVDDIATDVRARYGADSLVVGMDRYAIASELAFYSKDQTLSVAGTSSAHLFDDMGLMYEQWFPASRQGGRTLVLVAWNSDAISDARLAKHVADLGPVRQGVLTRNGSVVRRYFYRVVHGYRAT